MSPLKWTVVVTALAALVVGGIRGREIVIQTTRTECEVKEDGVRLEQLAPIVSQIEQYQGRLRTEEQKRAVIRRLRMEGVLSHELLDRLADAAPAALVLDRVLAQDQMIEISGRADSPAAVTGWGQRLEGQGVLEEFDLRGFRASGSDGDETGEFTVSGRLLPIRREASDEAGGAPEPGASRETS